MKSSHRHRHPPQYSSAQHRDMVEASSDFTLAFPERAPRLAFGRRLVLGPQTAHSMWSNDRAITMAGIQQCTGTWKSQLKTTCLGARHPQTITTMTVAGFPWLKAGQYQMAESLAMRLLNFDLYDPWHQSSECLGNARAKPVYTRPIWRLRRYCS